MRTEQVKEHNAMIEEKNKMKQTQRSLMSSVLKDEKADVRKLLYEMSRPKLEEEPDWSQKLRTDFNRRRNGNSEVLAPEEVFIGDLKNTHLGPRARNMIKNSQKMTTSLKAKVDDEIKQALKITYDEQMKLTDYKQQNTDRRWNKPRNVPKIPPSKDITIGGVKMLIGVNCALLDDERKHKND